MIYASDVSFKYKDFIVLVFEPAGGPPMLSDVMKESVLFANPKFAKE